MAAILRFARNRPFAFGVGFATVKTSFSDLLVQKAIEKREEIDWARNAAFATFGFFYLGGVQYAIYVPVFSRLFPGAASFAAKPLAQKLTDGPGIRALCSQVFLDQFVHHPLMYFPAFYMIKDIVSNGRFDPQAAVEKYLTNYKEDLTALWKLWVPSTFINFAFMPMWGRIPWVTATSLIWTCILSAMRGGSEIPAPEMVGPAVDHVAMELFQRSVASPAPQLRSDRAHVLINLHGTDRSGLVADVSRKIYQVGGMVTTSKMIKLGGDCSIILHACCQPEKLEELLQAFPPGAMEGIKFDVHTLGTDKGHPAPAYSASVRLTGPDQPGLLFKLSELLASHGLNIEHLQTEQHVAPRSEASPQLFTLHGVVSSSGPPDHAALEADIRRLSSELGVLCDVSKLTGTRLAERLSEYDATAAAGKPGR